MATDQDLPKMIVLAPLGLQPNPIAPLSCKCVKKLIPVTTFKSDGRLVPQARTIQSVTFIIYSFFIFPFTKKGKFSCVLGFWSVAILSVITISFVAAYTHLIFIRSQHHALHPRKLFEVIYLASSAITVLSQMWSVIKNRSLYKTLLKSVYPSNMRFFEAVSIFFACEAVILHFALPITAVPGSIYSSTYVAMSSMVIMCQAQVVALICELKSKLSNLISNEHCPHQIIQEHSKLVKCAKIISKLFGCHILLSVSISVLTLVIISHHIVLSLLKGRSILNLILKMINRCSQMMIMLHICEKTTNQFEDVYKKLFKFVRNIEELCADEELVLYLKVRRKVSFTACGFFELGYPLLTSIIGSVTTYLVILLQFNAPSQ